MTNPFGWDLPLTDAYIADSPYAPLTAPAESVAERLTMLLHLSFNARQWSVAKGNLQRYWVALGEHLEGAIDSPDVATWWQKATTDIVAIPIKHIDLVHEKNLLCRPSTLPTTPVPDQDVIRVLHTYALDLRDRARVWNRYRPKTTTPANGDDL